MLTASEVSIEIHYEVPTADAWLLALDNLVCEEIEMHHLLTIASKF